VREWEERQHKVNEKVRQLEGYIKIIYLFLGWKRGETRAAFDILGAVMDF
jgi:hypothetical protein